MLLSCFLWSLLLLFFASVSHKPINERLDWQKTQKCLEKQCGQVNSITSHNNAIVLQRSCLPHASRPLRIQMDTVLLLLLVSLT